MDLGLRGKACLVTGSTGGIGLETARLLADEGTHVVTCGRRADAPDVGEELHIPADLADATAPADVVQQAVGALGRIDVLVNNVGIAYIAEFEELADSDWDELWQLNVMSYVRTIRAVLPAMRERRDGAIVNVSSSSGKRPSTGMPNYSVTKAAVLSLSRLVADLYARDGVRCNAVAPGPTATEAWLGRGGLAEQQGERDDVLGKVAAGPARRAEGDRSGDRIPLLRARELRHRRRVERGRRDSADHHLAERSSRVRHAPGTDAYGSFR